MVWFYSWHDALAFGSENDPLGVLGGLFRLRRNTRSGPPQAPTHRRFSYIPGQAASDDLWQQWFMDELVELFAHENSLTLKPAP